MSRPSPFTNTLKLTVLLASLAGVLVLLGGFIGGQVGVVVGSLVGLALVGGSYWFSDRLAIRAAGARPLGDGELPWLRDDVHALAARAASPPLACTCHPTRNPTRSRPAATRTTPSCASPRACSAPSSAARSARGRP